MKVVDGDFFVKAQGRVLKSSPRKLNLVADLIRGQTVAEAIVRLTFCRKKAAGLIKKVLNSAIANAQYNYNMDVDVLYVKEVLVDKSIILNRVHPRAFGRSNKTRKRYGNVTIKLFK